MGPQRGFSQDRAALFDGKLAAHVVTDDTRQSVSASETASHTWKAQSNRIGSGPRADGIGGSNRPTTSPRNQNAYLVRTRPSRLPFRSDMNSFWPAQRAARITMAIARPTRTGAVLTSLRQRQQIAICPAYRA